MRKGQRVRITTIKAPRGRVMESLRQEFEARTVGTVEMGPDEAEWYAVQFPTVADRDRLNVHRSMLEPVRA
jgi:hypothetical protein